MEIGFSKKFWKKYQKLSPKLQDKTKLALYAFVENPDNRALNNHVLVGDWVGYRSINITGDYRAIFLMAKEDLAKFYTIDKHSNLYK